MAKQRIEFDDLVDPKAIVKLTDQLEGVLKVVKQIEKQAIEVGKTFQQDLTIIDPKDAEELKKIVRI